MTSLDLQPTAGPPTRPRTSHRDIPLSRIVTTELRKMLDTRSGSWLAANILILTVLATVAVIAFAPENQLTYGTFVAAVGIPTSLVLPMIAILSVTSEWSQRSGQTTFTLVPHRRRVIAAKAVASLAVAVVSIPLALGAGAVGTIIGSAIAGLDPTWDLTVTNLLTIGLANILSVLVGFTLGVLIRSSAAALVAYFVYQFVLPTLAMLLAASQPWFRDLEPWVDFDYAQNALFGAAVTTEQWAQIGVTGLIWLAIPLAVGLRLVTRAEVK